MFIDARTLPAGHQITTEVCVIGAGAAGITLAREFTGKSFQVAMLEGGNLDIEPEAQTLNSGFNVGLPYFPLDMTHARCFGGTTEWWGGQHDTGRLVFANWPLYIDYTNWLKDRPSLNGFSRHTGIEVTYDEVIEGNEPFFQKIAPRLQAGQPLGYT